DQLFSWAPLGVGAAAAAAIAQRRPVGGGSKAAAAAAGITAAAAAAVIPAAAAAAAAQAVEAAPSPGREAHPGCAHASIYAVAASPGSRSGAPEAEVNACAAAAREIWRAPNAPRTYWQVPGLAAAQASAHTIS